MSIDFIAHNTSTANHELVVGRFYYDADYDLSRADDELHRADYELSRAVFVSNHIWVEKLLFKLVFVPYSFR